MTQCNFFITIKEKGKLRSAKVPLKCIRLLAKLILQEEKAPKVRGLSAQDYAVLT